MKKKSFYFQHREKNQYQTGYKTKYLLESGSCSVASKNNCFYEAMWAEKTASEKEQYVAIQAY